MKKTGGVLLSMLYLERHSGVPMTRQLENKIRKAVLDGALKQNARMPSTRQLAQDLGISRLTVKNAFEQLTTEGFLETRQGSGTYVARLSTADIPLQPVQKRGNRRTPRPEQVTPHVKRIQTSLATTRLSHVRAFRPGIPALDLFPRRAWADALSRAIKSGDNQLLGYGPPSGLQEFKQAIAAHVLDNRGIDCDPDQIVITSGAQQAFSLVLLTLLAQGDTIWMEDPGHIAFRDAARLQGFTVHSVPLDEQGFSLEYAQSTYRPCTVAFVTPSHQHPMGMTMSLTRRLELLDMAQSNSSWIVEDDYDSEFHYEQRPLPALKALDKHDRVIYVGSFSKSMFPSMRLGYLICPEGLSPAFAAAETLLNQNISPLHQKAMSYFMEDGSFNAHIRKMRQEYRNRRDILVKALQTDLAGILQPEPCLAGMHLIARFTDKNASDRDMAQLLWDAGIDCLPISIFRDQATVDPGLLLGFACAPESQIEAKTRQMARHLGSPA